MALLRAAIRITKAVDMSFRTQLRDLLEPAWRNHPRVRSALRSTEEGLERIRTSAWERFPSLITPAPRLVYLTLTAHCNLRCKGCLYGREFMQGEQMPLQMVREVLEDMKLLHLGKARLYGGEPLVHRNIVEIVEECTRLGLPSYMTTNGMALKQKIDDLYEAGLREISVGLYGIGDEYDAYVQRSHRFARLEESLEYVRQRYGKRIRLSLNWLLMKPTCSLETVRETWRFAERFDAPLFINLVHYSLPYFTEGEDRQLQFTPEDRPALDAVIAEFMRLQSIQPRLLPTSATVLRSIPDWLIKGPGMRVPCDRHRLLWIGPDGTVQMCYVTFKLGNLQTQRLRDLLYTPTHEKAARDAFNLNCPNCHCGYESRTLNHAPTRARYEAQ